MDLARKSDDAILKVANLILDNLMDAANEINHEKHTRHFTPGLKRMVSKGYFEKVCKQNQAKWGHGAEREVAAICRRPASIAVVWRQRYSKQPGEFVVGLELVETDSRYLVANAIVY